MNQEQLRSLLREILVGTGYALTAALAGALLSAPLLGSARGSRAGRVMALTCALPGLFGSLVLGLALVRLLQLPYLHVLYKTPEALARHQALTYSTGPVAERWSLRTADREVQVGLEVVFRSNALHAQRALAVSGAGVALLPDWLVRDEIRRRKLRVVLPDWTTAPVHVNAIHRAEQRGAPRIRALVDHLRAAYGRSLSARAI